MQRISRKTLLALEAVLDIAYYGRLSPVQAQEITQRQGTSRRYLEQLMQQLVRGGILKGVRGPRGGYVLACERRKITAADVIRAILAEPEPLEPETISESNLGALVIWPLWQEMERYLLSRFNQITIEDLCRRAETSKIPRDRIDHMDFNI